jgi:vacuolar-type H+-ATPase subunit I/STV1
MRAVIDSDVLIDYLQGLPEAKAEIELYSDPLFSIISWIEVMCGAETEEERIEEVKELEDRKQNAYLAALMLLSATFHQLEELQDMGATRMRTKNHVNKTITSLEKDLDDIFDLGNETVDENVEELKKLTPEQKKAAIKERRLALGKYVDEGANQLRNIVLKYVKD